MELNDASYDRIKALLYSDTTFPVNVNPRLFWVFKKKLRQEDSLPVDLPEKMAAFLKHNIKYVKQYDNGRGYQETDDLIDNLEIASNVLRAVAGGRSYQDCSRGDVKYLQAVTTYLDDAKLIIDTEARVSGDLTQDQKLKFSETARDAAIFRRAFELAMSGKKPSGVRNIV